MSRADDDVQNWLDGLSFKAKRKLATTIRDEADKLASAIKQAAPVKTGALRDSVQVRRRKNDLDIEVTAGGDATTREVRTGSGVSYDYARAVEFGRADAPAEPFFFSTYREMAPEIRQNIESAIEEALKS
jgi:HK97 gp10 family phage protein